MQTGLYVGISAQMALEKRMNTLADNVANANTVGFRSTEVKFNEVLGDTRPARVSFASEGQEFLNTNNGGLNQTGADLDFAIKGDAYFQIDTPAGAALTRDGRFTVTNGGQLVTLRGYPVLDAGGAPIQLNMQAGQIKVGSDGVMHQNGNQVAALGLYEANFANGFTRFENSAVIPNMQPQPVVDRFDTGVLQGYVEESNVNPIQQMTQLISVTRAFDSVASLLRDSETSLSEAIKTLGGSK